jgi:hypothetical protein
MDELEAQFRGQRRDLAGYPLDVERQAPLPGGGRLVAIMALAGGADSGDAAIGVEPVMR